MPIVFFLIQILILNANETEQKFNIILMASYKLRHKYTIQLNMLYLYPSN